MPVTRPVNTTLFPTLMAVRLAAMVIEPIMGRVRDGLMLGMPVRVMEGLVVGMPVRVMEGLVVGMPVRVIEGLVVGMPVRVIEGVGVGVGVLVAANAPVVPPENSATERTPAPSARP
ncbi:hypothetical protein [Streptomyces sp. NPDC054783]